MKKAKSIALADFIWNNERGFINLHTRAYLLCPATRQGNQLPREFVNRQSQCIQDNVSIKAPVKSYTVENRENLDHQATSMAYAVDAQENY